MSSLVTCVMATGHQPERRYLAEMSIEAFRRQTYRNRELLILNEGAPFSLPDKNIREVAIPKGRPLGAIRNMGIDMAHGQLVMQWDDDDYPGRERIKIQVEAGEPSILRYELLVDMQSGEARVVDAAKWHCGGFPGTILHRRDTLARYEAIGKGEDTKFLSHLHDIKVVKNGSGDYIRLIHGYNTWDREHFAKFQGRPLGPSEQRFLNAWKWWAAYREKPKRVPPCSAFNEVAAVLRDVPHMNYGVAHYLHSLIRQNDVRDIVEIGHLFGKSTCFLASTGARVTTIDLHDSAHNTPRCEETLSACGLEAEIIRGWSHHELAKLLAAGRRFDLAYVDGGHVLGWAVSDMLFADRLLRPGGWLVMDDIKHPECPDVEVAWGLLPENYERFDGPNENVGVARKPL